MTIYHYYCIHLVEAKLSLFIFIHDDGRETEADLYWPANLDDYLADEEDQVVPQTQEPLYSSYDLKDMEERALGGVCKGKLQRKGKQPLLCRKIDLEQLEFTVRE